MLHGLWNNRSGPLERTGASNLSVWRQDFKVTAAILVETLSFILLREVNTGQKQKKKLKNFSRLRSSMRYLWALSIFQRESIWEAEGTQFPGAYVGISVCLYPSTYLPTYHLSTYTYYTYLCMYFYIYLIYCMFYIFYICIIYIIYYICIYISQTAGLSSISNKKNHICLKLVCFYIIWILSEHSAYISSPFQFPGHF